MDDFPKVPTQPFHAIEKNIRSGDILLCSGTSFFSNLIREATKSLWSHVAFILRVDAIERIMVLESVESIGVRAVTLSSYLNDYNGTGLAYPGQLLLARHQDVKSEDIKRLSQQATQLLGYPYATDEIVKIAARVSMNSLGITPHKSTHLPQREFICSEYAYVCFKSIGAYIEYDPTRYITPADFARSNKVKPLCYLATEAWVEQGREVEA